MSVLERRLLTGFWCVVALVGVDLVVAGMCFLAPEGGTAVGSWPWFAAGTTVAVSAGVLTLLARAFHVLRGELNRRRTAETALARTNADLLQAERLARLGSWSWDSRRDVVTWSEQVYRNFGLDPARPPPRYAEHDQLYTPESLARLDAAVQRALRDDVPFELELEARRPDGTPIVIKGRGQAARDADGTIVGLFGTSQEITEERRARDAIAVASERLKLAACAGELGVWDWDLQSGQLFWDEQMFRLYEVDPADFAGRFADWRSRLHPEDGERTEAAVWAALAPGGAEDFRAEFRVPLPSGRVAVIATQSRIFRDGAGRAVRMLGINRDITKAHELAAALERSRAALLEAQSLAKVGSWSWDPSTDAVEWSEELYRIYGRDARTPALTWKEHAELFAPPSMAVLEAAVRRALSDGEPYALDLEARRPDGSTVCVHAVGRAVRDAQGRISGLMGTVQDVTESRRALQREQEMTRQAQAAEQAKAQFLAVMSHEIRTPMNAILGFADLLAQEQLGPDEADHVRTIQQSGQALLRIIDDILDHSRLQAGRFEISPSAIDPAGVVEGVRQLMASSAEARGLTLRAEIARDLPPLVVADAGRLRQVLVNLVNNAIKFTPDGGEIVIRAERAEAGGVSLTVSDNGIGIPPDKLGIIFEPFAQADSSISRRYGGTGLGLAIARQLVELMGGTMTARSEVGRGTAFAFSLPGAATDWSSPPGPPPLAERLDATFAERHPLRILVAEDDPTNRRLITHLLTRLGYAPEIAVDGLRAVATCRRERFDLVLMDLHMPDLGGLEATAQIRAGEAAVSDSPGRGAFIVACTADVMPAKRGACLAAGMDDFLAKPIRLAALAASLRAAHGRRGAAGDGL